MTSIRQRRRNRHKLKAARREAKKPLVLTFSIDLTSVNEVFVQAKNTMAKLSETMAQPEFQESVNRAWQELARLVPLRISELVDTGTLADSFNFESAREKLVADREAELLHQYELTYHRYQVGLLREDEDVEDDCLGDASCKFNARSPHVQCAVNPNGGCTICQYFEADSPSVIQPRF
ncbi:MAG: hypothetical protein KME52_18615 [Desmonostoc geniculatum HA4340-LM1]|jgi:hypothetical protein|nr:hypothetical protein [Desmonostoc geniculatum HA4340-LM1]